VEQGGQAGRHQGGMKRTNPAGYPIVPVPPAIAFSLPALKLIR
jgi:hypothetical protein